MLGAFAFQGCVPIVVVPLPTPEPITEENAGSVLEPWERLARLDGDGFVEVAPHSIPPSHTYVLVHGWAPGWGNSVHADPRLRCWEARDGRGRPFEPWMLDLSRAISEANPHAVVLVYSWLDDAATGRFMLAQRRAFAHTDLHGRLLAESLEQALGASFSDGGGRIHLIGHSYGARVAVLGALAMQRRPAQVTIFDSPDAPLTHITGSNTGLADLLRSLPIGSGPDQVFVDNYVSMVGSPYHHSRGLAGVVDVVLTPPYSSLDYRHRHLYPMRFYAQTGGRDFGLGWSPLIARRAPVPDCYQQAYGRMAVERGCAGVPQ